ncbi:MAG: nucleotidyltransferase [Parvularculaceae bacterium]
MDQENPFDQTNALDEVLLDVATIIELSPRDRRIAANRYRRLKAQLEASTSPLAPFLVDGESRIYAQGSIATSTTIISGIDEDRFDVDAIVEIDVPLDWSDSKPLDLLEEALEGFPGVEKIVRCTRCVQLQFAFMHMDVTILDRRDKIQGDRPGEIFHSPDAEPAYRVPSNPWGFTDWFRSKIKPGQLLLTDSLNKRREANSKSRLRAIDEAESKIIADAEQDDLPPVIPARVDAQEAIALKLLKRNLNIQYENEVLKRPPTIYFTKKTGDFGYVDGGQSAQLYSLAKYIAREMRQHVKNGTRPEEENPSYRPDKITDRWPRIGADGVRDMEKLADKLEYLAGRLNEMAGASLAEIAEGIDELFGESIGKQYRQVLKDRYDRRNNSTPIKAKPRTGQILAPALSTMAGPSVEVPRHNFHCDVLEKKGGDGKS